MRDPGPLPIPLKYYDQLWASTLIRILRAFLDSIQGDWVSVSKLISKSGRIVKTTLVTDATYTIKLTDHIIDVNRAGAVCEEQFHHADFELAWGRVKALIWTHKIDGLSESDFILAAKLDAL